MHSSALPSLAAVTFLGLSLAASAEPKVVFAREPGDGHFHFPGLPLPSRNDAATSATFTIVDGERDRNGGSLERLHDGRLPDEPDQPGANFFFAQGSRGGRVLVDLGREIAVGEVASFSWHPGPRGPQIYTLYGADGKAPGFVTLPKRPVDPAAIGWELLAKVDTRPKTGPPDGQYGVRISDPLGSLGRFRYLLFDLLPSEEGDGQGNTFYSEIDVTDLAGPPPEAASSLSSEMLPFQTTDGRYAFTISLGDAPDLKAWVQTALAPAMLAWYPRIVDLLQSNGFTAPKKFSLRFTDDYQGVAATSNTRIVCDPHWYRKQLQGEGVGSVIHELVHVVQQYGRARGGAQTPGWLVEGIPDYVRWYLFEPQSHGAEVAPARAGKVNYSDSYRVSANFLHWVTVQHDPQLVPKLNRALREGSYDEAIWKNLTGHTLEELGHEWKAQLAKPQ